MPDDSPWERPLSRSGQRPARILGRDKPAPIERSRLETLPDTHELSLPETRSEEPRHARTKNLIYAEAAVKYVEEKLFLGSSNRAIDAVHGRAVSNKLGDSEVRRGLIDQLRNKSEKPLGMSTDAGALWHADQAEAVGMGNCGEQARVAFKYLLHHTDAKEVSVLSVGADHLLVAIGASPSELESATSGWSAFKLDEAPQLPEQTVFCDPWYHEWFPASEWPNKIRSILRVTQSAEVSARALASMDDEVREMFKSAGMPMEMPIYSDDWQEIGVRIIASRQEDTIADYQEYLHRHPNTVVPQRTSRAALVENAETRADGLNASAAESAVKSNRRVYEERPPGRDMGR